QRTRKRTRPSLHVHERSPCLVVALQILIHIWVRFIHYLLPCLLFLMPFPPRPSSPIPAHLPCRCSQFQRLRGGIQSATSIPRRISSFQVPHPSPCFLHLHPSVNGGVFVK